MAKSSEQNVIFDRTYIHTTQWRNLKASAFRTAHCLIAHADDYGLVQLEPIEHLRDFILESHDMRQSHIERDIAELEQGGILFQYIHCKQGRVAGFPDRLKPKPRPSLYTPVPFNIQAQYPAYAAALAKTNGKQSGQQEHHQGPALAQGIILWNAFAERNKLNAVGRTTADLEKKWNVRTGNTDFDLEAILQEADNSDFLLGKSGGRTGLFNLTFDWILKNDDNYRKILRGKYRNSQAKLSPGGAAYTAPQTNRRTEYVPDIAEVHESIFGGSHQAAPDPTHA